MLKKILLYSLLFVVVAVGTSLTVIFMNRASNKGGDFVEEEPQNSAFSKLVDATMNVENYFAEFSLSSDDGYVDVSGSASVLDLASNPSAFVVASGKIAGKPVSVSVKYKNDWLYAEYNNFKVKAKTDDIMDMVSVVGEMFESENGEGGSLDFDAILADIGDMEVKETESGCQMNLNISNIGKVSIWSDLNNLPVRVEAPELTILGAKYSFTLVGRPGKAVSVSVASTEIDDSLNLSESKDVILATLNTIKNMPVRLYGMVEILGQDAEVNVLVDRRTNVYGSVKLKDIEFSVSLYDGKLFVNACGTKMKGEISDLMTLFGAYANVDVDEILPKVKMTKNTIKISDISVSLKERNDFLSSISVSHPLFSGYFNVSNESNLVVKNPTEAYKEALTFDEVSSIVKDYMSVLAKDEYSFVVSGSYKNIVVEGKAYVCLKNSALDMYARIVVNGITLEFWNKDGVSYFCVAEEKVCFSNATATEIFDFACKKLKISTKDMIELEEVAQIVSDEIKSLSIAKDGGISLGMKDATIAMTIDENSIGIMCGIDLLNDKLNLSALVCRNAEDQKSCMEGLDASKFKSLDVFEADAKAAINTFTKSHSAFSGSIRIYGPCDAVKWIDMGILLDTYYVNGKIQLKLVLSGLPVTELITDTSVLNYKSQKAVITYKDGYVYVYRYGVKSSGTEILRFSRKYALKDLSMNILSDVIGLGGLFGSDIQDSLTKMASEKDSAEAISKLANMFEMDKVDNGFSVTVRTSTLVKQLSDVSIVAKETNDEISEISGELTAVFKIRLNLKAD